VDKIDLEVKINIPVQKITVLKKLKSYARINAYQTEEFQKTHKTKSEYHISIF
jgi:hypothetical protein